MVTLKKYDLIRNIQGCTDVLGVIHQTFPQGEDYVKHPSVRLWSGYALHLANYGLMILDALERQGGAGLEAQRERIQGHFQAEADTLETMDLPPWMGNIQFHTSHRRQLAFERPYDYPVNWRAYGPEACATNRLYWPDPKTGV